jgi:hypothetical protein
MSTGKIAIQFSNCLGNFILMTAALKILRHSHNTIDMITDEKILNDHPAIKAMAEEFFDDIKIKKPSKKEYSKIYTAAWSRPSWMPKLSFDWRIGASEVQVYLDMIQKSKMDFEGFLIKMANKPKLDGIRPRIVLANSSTSKGSRMGHVTGWDKFPQLSRTLIELGFDVILIGQGDELKGCSGQSFIDKLDIFETSFVISQCDLMICVDTGLMHVADALKIPIILLAGPTFITKSGPVISEYKIVRSFISCAPCYQAGFWNLCTSPKCMQMIEVEDVLKKVFDFRLRNAYYKKPKIIVDGISLDDEKLKIAIPYYTGCKRVEQAKRTWLYPEVVFAILDSNTKIREASFYESASSEDLGFKTRKKPLLNPIMQKLLDKYPNEDYYGYFNSDIILPAGKNVKQLLPEKGKVAALHHRLDVYPNGKKSRYVGKDGFIMIKSVLQDFLADFPQVVLGAGGWDGGLFYWLWEKYGEEAVDLRFDEILHVAHEKGWDGDDKDTTYNRMQVRKFQFPVNWDAIGEKYANLVRKQSLRKKIGIIQPRRLGDLLIVLPIARWLFDRGYEVWWPICHEWMDIKNYVSYVNFIDIGTPEGSYENAHEFLVTKVDRIIDLGIGVGRKLKWTLPFDEWKYKEAGVPFEERQNLQLNRDYKKEASLIEHLNLKDSYTVTHSLGSYRSFDFQISDSVEVEAVNGFSLLDWIGVLEKAEKIYCIDSSVSNLIDGLNIGSGKRFIKFNDNIRGGTHLARLSYDWQNVEKRQVHFFTIVWNGMPFIQQHLSFFEKLSFDWHWHIIEGPAQHGQDGGSRHHQSRGGLVPDDIEDETLSYLESISKHPQITIYPRREWLGKVDMINTFLKNVHEQCVLWQIDADEFYTLNQMENIYRIFMLRLDKNVGILSMIHFVGPNKYVIPPIESVTHVDTWGTEKCSRLWRYEPGLIWTSHAPPLLSFKEQKSFEIEDFFYHYAYVYEQQVKFKGTYYGYGNFVSDWKKLQNTKGKVQLGQFFPWLKDSYVTVDDWYGSHPISL